MASTEMKENPHAPRLLAFSLAGVAGDEGQFVKRIRGANQFPALSILRRAITSSSQPKRISGTDDSKRSV